MSVHRDSYRRKNRKTEPPAFYFKGETFVLQYGK